MKITVAERRIALTQGKLLASRRVLWWPLLLVAVLAFLGMLAAAETVWLPDSMPREYVARSSLVLVPRSGDTSVSQREWSKLLPLIAGQDEVLTRVISQLDVREEASGDLLSPTQLRQRMRFNTQCIQVADDGYSAVRGMLLSVTVRGEDNSKVEAIVDAWAESFLQTRTLQEIQVESAMGTPYLPCVEG